MPGGRDKFEKSSHYCNFWWVVKKAGKVYVCRQCGAVYTCKLIKGRLSWIQTRSGRR